MIGWEDEYGNSELLWGLKPASTLTEYAELVPNNANVLDLGMGEGRNAFFFAQRGCAFEGIDLSETAIARCLTLSEKFDLGIQAKVADITECQIKPDHYSLIILSDILNFFPDKEIGPMIDQVKKDWSKAA